MLTGPRTRSGEPVFVEVALQFALETRKCCVGAQTRNLGFLSYPAAGIAISQDRSLYVIGTTLGLSCNMGSGGAIP